MQLFKDIIENVWVQRAFWSIVIILLSLLIYRMITGFLGAKEKKNTRLLSNKKNKTIIRMLKSVVAGALSIFTILVVLQIYGVNVSSMLAGVGIVSIVVGFALQDSLKDIIRGFVIISDNYYEIGDVIKFGDNIGPVTSISLLTTKLQDINTMDIVSIANRNVDKVEVDLGYIYIPIPFSYDLKVETAESVIHEIIQKLRKHKDITSAAYQGVTKIDTSALDYQIALTCDPANRLQIRRDALRVIMTTFEEHKIHVPYTQLDLHTKK